MTKGLEVAKANIVTLEDSLKKEREMVKSLQGEISNYREEALNVKHEKKEMKVKLGQQESKLNDLKEDQTKLREEKANYEKSWKETSEALNVNISDYKKLHKEKVKVEKVLNDSLAEIEIFKKNLNEPHNKMETVFTCPFCEDQLKCRTELSQHVRLKHVRDQVSQTEGDLVVHRTLCHNEPPGDHAPTVPTYHPRTLPVRCDFCDFELENLLDLQCHIRTFHRNMLPHE